MKRRITAKTLKAAASMGGRAGARAFHDGIAALPTEAIARQHLDAYGPGFALWRGYTETQMDRLVAAFIGDAKRVIEMFQADYGVHHRGK